MSAHFRGKGGRPPTTFGDRIPGLSRGVVGVILRLAVLIQYRRVTHRHTDRGSRPTVMRRASAARVKTYS